MMRCAITGFLLCALFASSVVAAPESSDLELEELKELDIEKVKEKAKFSPVAEQLHQVFSRKAPRLGEICLLKDGAELEMIQGNGKPTTIKLAKGTRLKLQKILKKRFAFQWGMQQALLSRALMGKLCVMLPASPQKNGQPFLSAPVAPSAPTAPDAPVAPTVSEVSEDKSPNP